MKIFFKIALASFLFPVLLYETSAQESIKADFSQEAWEIIKAENYKFETHKGKKSLYLENGKVRLKGAKLKNGVIDFDILFAEGRKFLNFHFRVKDSINYEEFYLRPHQSGNPDAMQYTPVYNGTAGWQLYHGEGYSNAYSFNFNEWIHVRLIIANDKMDVFLNDMSIPVLSGSPLKIDPIDGGMGFSTARGGAYFANLTYTKTDNPPLVSKPREAQKPDAGTIRTWQVSNAIAEKDIKNSTTLTKEQLKWTTMPTEPSGTINLAQVSALTEATNTVLVKKTIDSDRAQVKRIDFGYSDIARVFINGTIVYEGQHLFRSRDYRYLGTIGYFDAIFAPLKKGKNEIVFAITENFGGWGIKAKMENLDGVSLK